MYKVVGIWGAPKLSDIEEFEKYYLEVHVPLARKVPHLRRLVLTRMESGLEGLAPAFYRLAELLFDNPEAMARASESPEWHAMREDGGKIVARFGVSLQAASGWESE